MLVMRGRGSVLLALAYFDRRSAIANLNISSVHYTLPLVTLRDYVLLKFQWMITLKL